MCQNTSSFILISLIMKDVKEKLIFGWQFLYIYIYNIFLQKLNFSPSFALKNY